MNETSQFKFELLNKILDRANVDLASKVLTKTDDSIQYEVSLKSRHNEERTWFVSNLRNLNLETDILIEVRHDEILEDKMCRTLIDMMSLGEIIGICKNYGQLEDHVSVYNIPTFSSLNELKLKLDLENTEEK